jgi:FkbM family methyltransferase
MILTNRIRKALGVAAAIDFGLRNGLRNRPIVLVDIGGRGGFTRRSWQFLWRVGLVKPVFFEPDPKAASQIRARYGRSATVLEKAAWSTETRKILHVTSDPGCSSILVPMPDPRMPQNVKEMLTIDQEIDVELVTAETALLGLGVIPEIVKIDVQGGEMEVLRGFGSLFRNVLCCELEVSFMRGYRNEPLFDEVFNYMVNSGFGLFELKVFGVAGTRHRVQADAYFCRRDVESRRQEIVETIFCRANDFIQWP